GRLGRPGRGAGRPVYGQPRCDAAQPRHRRLLPSTPRGGQAEEGRAHGLYAQTPHDPQRDDEAPDRVEAGPGSWGLTRETVALPSRESVAQDRAAAFFDFVPPFAPFVPPRAARQRPEWATQPKMPPWALIIFSAAAWNSGK